MDTFIEYPLVERVLGHGDTKSSVLLRRRLPGRPPARVRPRAAAPRCRTSPGSKAHNIALRDRAVGMGLKLNEYGLFRSATGASVAGEREEDIYAALGLAWVPPELREIAAKSNAAAAGTRSRRLVTHADLRGDLHMHTTETDGKGGSEVHGRRPRATRASNTSRSPTTASRSRWPTASTSGARSSTPRGSARSTGSRGVRLLAGIECDILADGVARSRRRLPRRARPGGRLGAFGVHQDAGR